MIDRIFLAHPRRVGETYGQHMAFALGVAGELFVAGAACAVHAVAPALCERTASRTISALHHRLTSGHRKVAAAETSPDSVRA